MWKSHKKPQTTTTKTHQQALPWKIKRNCSISWRHSSCQFNYWDFKKVGNAQVNGTLNVTKLEFLLIILNDQNDPTSKGSDPICQLFSERNLRGNERTRRIPRVTIIHTETTVDCGLFLLNCMTRDSFHLQRRRKKRVALKTKEDFSAFMCCCDELRRWHTCSGIQKGCSYRVIHLSWRKHADTWNARLSKVKLSNDQKGKFTQWQVTSNM